MASNTRYYYSPPTQASQSRSGSRRPPLTPSTVSSPCLSTHPLVATRRDSGAGSPTKASALLAKVASHPSAPRGETPSTSPTPSPDTQTGEMYSSPIHSSERPAMWRSESARLNQERQSGTCPFVDVAQGMMVDDMQMATSASPTMRSSASRTARTRASIESTQPSRPDSKHGLNRDW